jgi:hypothetical protein
VGSRIVIAGRVLGIACASPKSSPFMIARGRRRGKRSEPRLLVIGSYRMAFQLEPRGPQSLLRVTIDYALPASGISRILARLFSAMYARWCVERMIRDASAAFASRRGRARVSAAVATGR